MAIRWLEELVGRRIIVQIPGRDIDGYLEDVVYDPTPALLLADIADSACDALVNYRFVDHTTPTDDPPREQLQSTYRSVKRWLESVSDATEVWISLSGAPLAGRIVSIIEDLPLTLMVAQEEGEPKRVNWDSVRAIIVPKQTAGKRSYGDGSAPSEDGEDDGMGGDALGAPVPVTPRPSGSAKEQLAIPRC